MTEALERIPVFVTVAEEGGFRAAGKRLRVTGSAVSHAVKRLEERLGITLPHRTTRSVRMTEAESASTLRAWSLPGGFAEQDENETAGSSQPVSFSFDPLVPCRARQHPPAAQDDLFARGQSYRSRRLPLAAADDPRSAYSARIATIGSTRSARRVGTTQASRHTPSMNAA